MDAQNPGNLRISDYSYSLPEEKIAHYPLASRDQSKLLIYRYGAITEDSYRNLAQHLPEASLLVLNNTRVIEARLLFQKITGALIEIFLLEPDDEIAGIDAAINRAGNVWWRCLVGGAGKWKHGQTLSMKRISDQVELTLNATIVEKNAKNFTIEFNWTPSALTFSEVLHATGSVPIPPYLKRASEPSDTERYQTVYAEKQGSVAAPTAGLHFTESLLQSLSQKKIRTDYVTLHVGAGTFLPVKSAEMSGHEMHAEYLDVGYETIENLLENTGNIFAVGTTSLRTLESLYWMGIKAINNPSIPLQEISIRQWEVYEELSPMAVSATAALSGLLEWMKKNQLKRLLTRTEILIAPPYQPKVIKGLITNFHQPHSTLLLLVAAVIGEDWKRVYAYALENDFRFLSYGDGCLLFVH